MATNEQFEERIRDNFEQARSHEKYRAEFAKITLTLLGLLAALLSIESQFVDRQIILFSIAFFGLFSALVSAKHYERNRFHNKYADHLLSFSEKTRMAANLSDTFHSFRDNEKWEHHWLRHVRLNWLWTAFPLSVSALAIIFLLYSNNPDDECVPNETPPTTATTPADN